MVHPGEDVPMVTEDFFSAFRRLKRLSSSMLQKKCFTPGLSFRAKGRPEMVSSKLEN